MWDFIENPSVETAPSSDGELTQKSEEEMMKVRNLGRKSLKEVVQKLREIGLDLKNSSNLFDDDSDFDDEEDDSEE